MGRQFANDSMTPEPIAEHEDSYGHCLASDRPMHEEATAGNGSFNWDAGHYATDFSGYGKSAGGSKATSVDVTGDKANRGAES